MTLLERAGVQCERMERTCTPTLLAAAVVRADACPGAADAECLAPVARALSEQNSGRFGTHDLALGEVLAAVSGASDLEALAGADQTLLVVPPWKRFSGRPRPGSNKHPRHREMLVFESLSCKVTGLHATPNCWPTLGGHARDI